ncbi:MAG TPA: cytochrome c [Bryobacteraceae bacterium]|nr:cytochrome c [Bryobacteraceae bacterium]
MRKRLLLTLGGLLLALLVAAGAGIGWLFLRQPAMAPALNIHVARTPERIARGKYIFVNVADCGGCHSERDFTRVGGPEVESGRGRGNILSDLMKGLPGQVVAPNLTPDAETGIGTWTDGEKIRAIREGVDNKGRALFNMMPYQAYRLFSDDDVQALVAFLDSLPPVHYPLPQTKLDFPVSVLIKSDPQPAGSVAPVDHTNPRKYGEYLAAVGGCTDCHTPVDAKNNPLPGKLLAGGMVFDTPLGKVLSANLTPDAATGIGKWSEAFFQKKFYDYKDYAANGPPPSPGPQSFTLMPWLSYSGKDPEELSALYAYLRSVPAVHNAVDSHPGFPKTAAAP